MEKLRQTLSNIANSIHRFLKSCDGERIATLSMRFARPVSFMLMTAMLIAG